MGAKFQEKTGYFLFVYILATSENFYLKSSTIVEENFKNYLYGMGGGGGGGGFDFDLFYQVVYLQAVYYGNKKCF